MAGESTREFFDGCSESPRVRAIERQDLMDAFARGFKDFTAKPSHLVFLGMLYALACLIGSRIVIGYDVLPLLFPILAGMALIGPFAAIGLYEISRRRERGEDISLGDAFAVIRAPSRGAIVALGTVLLAIFIVWLGTATAIYVALFGDLDPVTPSEFVRRVFTTPSGWLLMIVGNAIGAVFALLVLAIGSVSFPMMVDRTVDVNTAVRTSVRALLANPRMMLSWGLLVIGLLVLGSIPFFIGLAIVVPVLGHATWHLYRKVVEPE